MSILLCKILIFGLKAKYLWPFGPHTLGQRPRVLAWAKAQAKRGGECVAWPEGPGNMLAATFWLGFGLKAKAHGQGPRPLAIVWALRAHIWARGPFGLGGHGPCPKGGCASDGPEGPIIGANTFWDGPLA